MKNFYQKIITQAQNTIDIELNALQKLKSYIREDFAKVVELIYNSKGRLVITGIGKSANIANKIVATLNSTGTPALFMHAADAIHGDLGIIQKNDIVLCISKSGNTPEIKLLAPLIKTKGNILIAMVSDLQSFLAKNADYILQATIEKEACPNNLAPTTSTTVQLVLGDALAVCLLEQKEFSSEDFAKIHPGGSLGKKLYMRVADIYIQNEVPKILAQEKLSDIIYEISSKRLGATAVVDKENNLLGIITDGDIRRMLQEGKDTDTVEAGDIMTKSPKFVYDTEMAAKAFHLMESNKITQMIVLDKENKYLGIIHLHDILKEGIV